VHRAAGEGAFVVPCPSGIVMMSVDMVKVMARILSVMCGYHSHCLCLGNHRYFGSYLRSDYED
jgi:hypothetical protein